MREASRNDPCPCGSGKKYKRCCLETDTRRPAAGVPAMPKVPALDVKLMERSLKRFSALLTAGKLPEELFASREKFDPIVAEVSQELALGQPGPEVRHELFRRVAPKLWPEGLGYVSPILESVVRSGALKKEDDLVAFATVGVMAEVGPVEDNPVAEVLFTVQMARWAKEGDEFNRKMRRFAEEIRRQVGKDASAEELMAAAEARAHELLPLATSKEGARMLEQAGSDAVETVVESIRKGEANPLLRADEWIWLNAVMASTIGGRDLSTAGDEVKREVAKAIHEAMDDELIAAVTARAQEMMLARSGDAKVEAWYHQAVVALNHDPMRVLVAAVTSLDFLLCTEVEGEGQLIESVLARWETASAELEPYRRFLAEAGATAEAERIARARERLGWIGLRGPQAPAK